MEAKLRDGGKPGDPTDIEIDLFENPTWSPDSGNVPNSAHVCEVEIDPETGVTEVTKYIAIHDVGVELNPLLVDGQVHGGIAQGLGQVLMEHIVYDEDGQFSRRCNHVQGFEVVRLQRERGIHGALDFSDHVPGAAVIGRPELLP